jgi:hypothetical protein
MYLRIHEQFICTPIQEILQNSCDACSCIGSGIETQPLKEYVLQSTFLKMTGASEQKLKCICWEMATYDYEYRYQLLQKPLGECSNYKDKNSVYMNITKEIKHYAVNYNIMSEDFSDDVKTTMVHGIYDDMSKILCDSIYYTWEPRAYREFLTDRIIDESSFIVTKDNILSEKKNNIKRFYEQVVYRYRNRCAHNLRSYQSNAPTLMTLAGESNQREENYFNMIAVLILLDEIFISLYKIFVNKQGLSESY